jgi:RNA-directed DNA polymerase
MPSTSLLRTSVLFQKSPSDPGWLILPFEKLDKWLRRRLRQVRWKEWKRPQTRYRNLRALGIPDRDARSWAASQKGYWRVAGSWPLQTALPNAYWHQTTGLKGFLGPYRRFRGC